MINKCFGCFDTQLNGQKVKKIYKHVVKIIK